MYLWILWPPIVHFWSDLAPVPCACGQLSVTHHLLSEIASQVDLEFTWIFPEPLAVSLFPFPSLSPSLYSSLSLSLSLPILSWIFTPNCDSLIFNLSQGLRFLSYWEEKASEFSYTPTILSRTVCLLVVYPLLFPLLFF